MNPVELPNAPSADDGNIVTSILTAVCGALCSENPLGQAFGKQSFHTFTINKSLYMSVSKL